MNHQHQHQPQIIKNAEIFLHTGEAVSPPSSSHSSPRTPRTVQLTQPRAPRLSRTITSLGSTKTPPYFDFPNFQKSNSPSSSPRLLSTRLSPRLSPPLIPENENIKLEELEPLTEMDRILFEKEQSPSKKTSNLSLFTV